ncbi:hypothetical protein [Levilactobacillus acidifarinae]|uniref:Uncharacterized protein n=1 Tax=Levilactobacillus acidifarinae DSM 19394 = JCM 15949 TaxID=1423715 RepID=A0A0R1LJL2_9LACO|nr:hypothetical protein [Levilactobacillus acidifarinae]KRK96139.1 hypothetical protein FD25_GL002603 [Levilactobacillus acidifarinae DSM 19394]GEO69501.1 hypothetical protein LAC03_14110 [Levilactobacillus acidifarinae]
MTKIRLIIIGCMALFLGGISFNTTTAYAWHYTTTPKSLRGTWHRNGHQLKVTKYRFGQFSGKKQFVGPEGDYLNGSQLYVSKHKYHGYWTIGENFTDNTGLFKRTKRHGRTVMLQKISNLGNYAHPYSYHYYYK